MCTGGRNTKRGWGLHVCTARGAQQPFPRQGAAHNTVIDRWPLCLEDFVACKILFYSLVLDAWFPFSEGIRGSSRQQATASVSRHT
jgi:hypothetical protein